MTVYNHTSLKDRAASLCQEIEKAGLPKPVHSSSFEDESEHIEIYTDLLHSVIELLGNTLSVSVYNKETHQFLNGLDDISLDNSPRCIAFLKDEFNNYTRR